jgi:hypothetical protein
MTWFVPPEKMQLVERLPFLRNLLADLKRVEERVAPLQKDAPGLIEMEVDSCLCGRTSLGNVREGGEILSRGQKVKERRPRPDHSHCDMLLISISTNCNERGLLLYHMWAGCHPFLQPL